MIPLHHCQPIPRKPAVWRQSSSSSSRLLPSTTALQRSNIEYRCQHINLPYTSKVVSSSQWECSAIAGSQEAQQCLLQHQQQQQQRLEPSAICQLVAANDTLRHTVGDVDRLEVEELLDGVINVVYAVHGSKGSVIMKQALPYVRAVGASFPLSRERMEVEAAAMQLLHHCCPEHVPQLLMYDPTNSILAMQYLAPPHQKLLYAIRHKQILPQLADQLSALLASYLAHTNLQLLPEDAAAAAIKKFANHDIVAANERVVLISPFGKHDTTNRITPELQEDVQHMWSDPVIQAAAADLLQLYRTSKQCLIHNDLHAGNLFVAPGSLYLIDWEFATAGPAAFDIGCLLGNIMLAVLSLQGMHAAEQQQQGQHENMNSSSGGGGSSSSGDGSSSSSSSSSSSGGSDNVRQQQADWLLQVLVDAWTGFQQRYPAQLAAAAAAAGTPRSLWTAAAAAAGPPSQSPSAAAAAANLSSTGQPSQAAAAAAAAADQLDDAHWQQLLLDSCGFAGCCLVRLTIGIHHYPDTQNIESANVRISVERKCLQLGQQLLLLRQQHGSSTGSWQAAGGGSSSSSSEGDISTARTVHIDDIMDMVRSVCGAW